VFREFVTSIILSHDIESAVLVFSLLNAIRRRIDNAGRKSCPFSLPAGYPVPVFSARWVCRQKKFVPVYTRSLPRYIVYSTLRPIKKTCLQERAVEATKQKRRKEEKQI
jgi:hypothetical protein